MGAEQAVIYLAAIGAFAMSAIGGWLACIAVDAVCSAADPSWAPERDSDAHR